MHSWIFRNRRRLEAIYGAPGRIPARRCAGVGAPGGPRQRPEATVRLVVYEMIPRARRRHAA